jgi:type II secretory pathway component PulF
MPTYRHQSIDRTGAVTAGVLAAPDRATAIRQLQAQGMMPTALEAAEAEAPAKAAPPAKRPGGGGARGTEIDLGAMMRRAGGSGTGRPTLKRAELANIVRELATAIEAGLPLLNAL